MDMLLDPRLAFTFAVAMLDLATTPSAALDKHPWRPFLRELESVALTSERCLAQGGGAKVMVALAVFAFILIPDPNGGFGLGSTTQFVNQVVARGNIHLPKVAHLPLRQTPMLHALPLPSFGPGDDNGAAFLQWLKGQTHAMTNPAELTSGTWQGYYSYGFSAADIANAPMTDVKFTMTQRKCPVYPGCVSTHDLPDHPKTNLVSGTGTDHGGAFTLSGMMMRDGKVSLSQRYPTIRREWIWTAAMTPFGICGYWTRTRHGKWYGGLIWLWKKEWCG